MDLYNAEGYINFRTVRGTGMPFIFLLGGRGTGKTYGALESSIEDGVKFCYLRRYQAQLDLVNKPEFSPIRPVCQQRGWKYTMRPVARGLSGFVPYEIDDDGREIITGPPVGITAALSTVGNIRGFDSSDVELAIYDEAIPETGDRSLPHEADKLANFYETFNRNRELQGRDPMQLVCMANANDQASPILQAWGLTDQVDRMRKNGREIWLNPKRGVALIILQDSPISTAKKQTALYKLTAGSDYAAMALSNEFAYTDRSHVRSMPLGEYTPLAQLAGWVIYKHKSEPRFYVSPHVAGAPHRYQSTEQGREKFRLDYGYLWACYVDGRVDFETFAAKLWFTEAVY